MKVINEEKLRKNWARIEKIKKQEIWLGVIIMAMIAPLFIYGINKLIEDSATGKIIYYNIFLIASVLLICLWWVFSCYLKKRAEKINILSKMKDDEHFIVTSSVGGIHIFSVAPILKSKKVKREMINNFLSPCLFFLINQKSATEGNCHSES